MQIVKYERFANNDQATASRLASGATGVAKKSMRKRMWFAAMCGVERQVFVIFSYKHLERNGTIHKGTDLIARACMLDDVVGKKAEATQSNTRSP